jgi:hypothetical protein
MKLQTLLQNQPHRSVYFAHFVQIRSQFIPPIFTYSIGYLLKKIQIDFPSLTTVVKIVCHG